jgi:hypothetical protein
MASPQVRSKAWGYAVEVAAKKALERLFPGIARTGSVAYTKAAADLVRPGTRREVIRLIVTRDKRRQLLVSLSALDLETLLDSSPKQRAEYRVVAQVKGRQSTWLGRLYDDLVQATK